MKKLIILFCLLATSASAESKSNNAIIKDCLAAYNYDYNAPVEQRLNNFNWHGASYCAAGFIEEQHKQRLAEQQEFLKKNPWFRGTNWKWELYSEYKCNKVNSDVGPVTVCSKPYYIN